MINNEAFEKPTLRVIMLTPGLSPGGAERWMAMLYEHRRSVKYPAIVSAGRSGNELAHHFTCLRLFANGQNDDIVAKVDEAVKQGCDLIVYWGLEGIWELHKWGIPVMQVSHCSGSLNEPTNPGHRQFVEVVGKSCANYLAAVSESAAKIFPEEIRRLDPPKVVHNGVDVERTRPGYGREVQRKWWGLSSTDKMILYVGRFNESKNVHKIIKALRKLPEEWKLVLYGWGDQKQKYVSLCPAGRVKFPKPRLDALGDVYAACDVVVIPSQSEAFPLVMVEAWQAGLPLICTEFETLLEVENTYNNGKPMAKHVPLLATPEEIATAILEEYPQEMVDTSQMIAITHFSASAMVARWESLFYNCVKDWHSRGQIGAVYTINEIDTD